MKFNTDFKQVSTTLPTSSCKSLLVNYPFVSKSKVAGTKLVWIQLYELNWLVGTRHRDSLKNYPFCKLWDYMYMWYMRPGHLWKPFKRLPVVPGLASVTSPLVCVNIPAISHFWVCATRWRNTFTTQHHFTPCIFKMLCTSLDSEESLNCIYARYEVVDKNIKMCMYVQNDINIKIHIYLPQQWQIFDITLHSYFLITTYAPIYYSYFCFVALLVKPWKKDVK